MATDLGDKHMTLFLAGIVEVPGYILGDGSAISTNVFLYTCSHGIPLCFDMKFSCVTAAISLHFLGRRGPMFFFHALVAVFMACVAAINVFGPKERSSELESLLQIFYFGAKFG